MGSSNCDSIFPMLFLFAVFLAIILNVSLSQVKASGSGSRRSGTASPPVSLYHSSSSHTTGSMSAPWRNSGQAGPAGSHHSGSSGTSSGSSVNQERTQHVIIGKGVGKGSKWDQAQSRPPGSPKNFIKQSPPSSWSSGQSEFKGLTRP